MLLETLLKDLDVLLPLKAHLISITGIACHSKQVKPGNLFIAVKGAAADGTTYIPEAIHRGAKVIVSEENFSADATTLKVIVKDSREALARLCHRFYGLPSEKLRVIGITGTNGKTTVSYLIESFLKKAGYGVGVIGTITHRVGERAIPAQNTTPGPLELNFLLSQMVQSKTDYAVMEVSSHALDQRRVDQIRFSVAVFTNLAHDHLDYHKTQESYFQAKHRLFESLDERATSILNADSPYAKRIQSTTRSRCLTYGLEKKAEITASSLKKTREGVFFEAVTPAGILSVRSSLLGTHNVYNLLAAIGVGICQGIPLPLLRDAVEAFPGVPGRLERVEAGQPFNVFIDFAHTEEALKQVLLSLRELTSGRLIVVFGCGGNRDRAKRPRMGETASRLSDVVVVTSDNPRNEDPQGILKEIEAGFPASFPYQLEEDRARAIETALLLAKPGDTVLIAGKGHEAYQIFRDRTVPFDDRQVAYGILSRTRNPQSYGGALPSRRG